MWAAAKVPGSTTEKKEGGPPDSIQTLTQVVGCVERCAFRQAQIPTGEILHSRGAGLSMDS